MEAYNKGADNYQLQQQRHWQLAPKEVECSVCRRLFRRESDKVRHKCITEREKPVSEQVGAVKCQRCNDGGEAKEVLQYTVAPQRTQTQIS